MPFPNLRDYILATRRIEPPVCYDAELNDWTPVKPLGTATFVNCSCGSTLALTSHGMPVLRLWSLYNWARNEKKRRDWSMDDLLKYLQDEIHKRVLAGQMG